ncbi:vanadium-dependent haloperoxidase [Longimicrobium sp.]|uniref:vanadium-dependent haloperoxidase n=1 Tax=Longimicrobium sp. TaxID=2029185 RepID=UPI002E36CFC7|nr:vanadium-dependent haloperoxidase [Longimicrobium sp.]HEX6040345.1 vanadium-dependent haloperoxidase [Longimicrobium sp.]
MAKAHTLVDNFNDNTLDATKWTVTSPTGLASRIREVNGRLEIRPAPSLAGVNQYFYRSAGGAIYDLTGSMVFVEVVGSDPAPVGSNLYLIASQDSTNAVFFFVGQGLVSAVTLIAGTQAIRESIPHDPQAHRWLRMRERAGTLYWELSADGTAWTVLFSMAAPIPLTALYFSLGANTQKAAANPGLVVFDNFNVQNTTLSRRVEERRLSARDVRVGAAQLAAERRHDEHHNNNDETNYPAQPLVGNYSKSLRHDALGDPDPASYATLLRALESRDPQDFEEIILSDAVPSPVKLTNPQGGLAFDIAGPDAQERTIPPAPRFDSDVTAHEMGELYWMAVLRDVPFSQYDTNTDAAAAIGSLNDEFPRFGGTVPVTAGNLFRGIYPGEQVGPYVSQFLLKGNVDPRKFPSLGRDATDGYISYGARGIDQRLITAEVGLDHLTVFDDWLAVQNGADARGGDSFDINRVFIRTLRDGATLVHFDQVIDTYYNAAWLLQSEPTGNQETTQSGITGRPQIDFEFPKNDGNPYDPPGTPRDSRTQVGFGTFGQPHLFQVLSEVLGRAIRAVWWQKWGVHRRLRPEEYGGRVHNQVRFNQTSGAEGRSYPLHPSIVTSLTSGDLAPYFGSVGERFQSYLLPQAYPEGAPTHPAYGAGHATGSGAMVTILKAFFDEDTVIENPVEASPDGLTLVDYTPPVGEAPLTVGGELNKLAGNIAIFRNGAGVHWRSDYTESLPFGEAIAIGLLQEMSLGFNEDNGFFELTKFDGQKIRIFDGKVVPVVS